MIITTNFSLRAAAFFFIMAAFIFRSFFLFLSTPYMGSSRRGEVLFRLEARVETHRADGSFLRGFFTFFLGVITKDLPPLRRDRTTVFSFLVSLSSEDEELWSSSSTSISYFSHLDGTGTTLHYSNHAPLS